MIVTFKKSFLFGIVSILICLNTIIIKAQVRLAAIDTSKALLIIKNRQQKEYIEFEKGNKETPKSFLEKYPEIYGLSSITTPVLKHEEKDELGMIHTRYGLRHLGFDVEDSDYWFHSKKEELHSANGYLPEITENLKLPLKIIDSVAAIKICLELEEKNKINNTRKKINRYEAKLLWVTPNKDTLNRTKQPYFLAWRLTNNSTSIVAYVNAESGQLCYWYKNEQSCQAPVNFTSNYYQQRSISTVLENGAYSSRSFCYAYCGGVYKDIRVGYYDYDALDIVPITSSNNSWTTTEQRNIGTALWAANNTYDYFCDKHKWNSYDGENTPLMVDIASNQNTGSWTGGGSNLAHMIIGGISANTWITQDIVAHEFTHGIIGKFSGSMSNCNSSDVGKVLSCQLNSINESVADMLGTAVEYYALPSTASFLYGEDAANAGFPIRNLSNPKLNGYPNCFKTDAYPNPVNWCLFSCPTPENKPYNNGAVLSFWFHLLCNGGSGRVDDNINYPAYSVSAIGIDKTTKIIFRALRYYMPWAQPSNGYYNLKLATLEAAKDLYGNCANEVIQISNAWKAVGLDAISYSSSLALCGDFGTQSNPLFQYHHINSAVSLPASTCSPQNMVVKNGSKLILTSTQGIVLKSGFKAETGSIFKATTSSCSSSTNRLENNSTYSFGQEEFLDNNTNDLQLYPNPATHMVSLKLPLGIIPQEVTCSLYTSKGVLKLENFYPRKINVESLEFQIDNLETGLYFVKVTPYLGKNTFLKLIIQH